MVQCVPVLRPFVKDLHTSLTSRRLGATEPSKGSTWRGSTLIEKKEASSLFSRDEESGQKTAGRFELAEIPEEAFRAGEQRMGHSAGAYYSPSELELGIQASHTRPLNANAPRRENWPL